MSSFRIAVLSLCAGLVGCATVDRGPSIDLRAASTAAVEVAPIASEAQWEQHGIVHAVLLYIPNRFFDLCDPFRLRLRAGPGLGAGVRATTAVDAYLGAYISVFAGLPGPRMRPQPRLPIGVETYNGIGFSIIDATAEGPIGPRYSPTEFGINLHPLVVGADVGIDPIELVDLFTGILMIDIRHDDF